MKRTSLLLGAALAMGLGSSCMHKAAPITEEPLTLMSYNVRNGIGMDDSLNYQRAADIINKHQPDIVAVQELDSMTNRSGQHYVLKELGDRTNMYPSFAPAIDYDGGKYGIGILSKEKPLRCHSVALPGREEARTLLVAEFEKYLFCCTHLSLTEEDRLLSLDILRKEAEATQKPFFIAGDWNATPQEPFIREVSKSFHFLSDTTQFTHPADTPNVTIDYIAVALKDTARVKYVSGQVLNEPVASDHRPVLATINLK